MKTSKINFDILKRIMYEFTGNEVWFRSEFMTFNFCNFQFVRNEIKKLISSGEVCKYRLISLDGKEKPFLINSINL